MKNWIYRCNVSSKPANGLKGGDDLKSVGNFVPEGHARIAQHLSVGGARALNRVPNGTADMLARRTGKVSRSFGTYDTLNAIPNAEALGYSQTSLRDEIPMLTATGVS